MEVYVVLEVTAKAATRQLLANHLRGSPLGSGEPEN